jgi:TPR repeat protein
MTVSVALATLERRSLVEKQMTLVVGATTQPPPNVPTSANATATIPADALSALFRPKTPDHELALKLMRNGDDNMRTGNVLAARQFYQRAAEYGLAEGARALGTTYDPAELSRMRNLVGIEPNPPLAQKWYAAAKELRAQELRAQARW